MEIGKEAIIAGSLVNKDVKGGTRVKGVLAKKLDMKSTKILKLLVYKDLPTLQNAEYRNNKE